MRAWRDMGLIYGMLGNKWLQKELDCYEKAIEIDPANSNLWWLKSTVFERANQYKKDIACCDMATEIDPTDVDAWVSKGDAYARLGQYDMATLVYERAVLAVPVERMTEIRELTKRNMAIVKSDNARHRAVGILRVVRLLTRF